MQPNPEQPQRIPPHNLEAERAVLGACLLDAQAAANVRAQLKPEDFYAPQHQLIYGSVARLVDNGKPADPVTLGDLLREDGDLERAGGMAYLSGLLDAVPAPAAAGYYAEIVLEKAKLRAYLNVASLLQANIYEGGHEAAELQAVAEKAIFDIAMGRRQGDLHPLSELLPQVYVLLSNIKASSGIIGIPTFGELDKLLSGLQKSDLIILAARPSVGKSSMAINIAQNAAARHGKVVAVFSLEMPKEQLVQRMLCTEAEVDQDRARKGMISKEDFRRLKAAVGALSGAALYIDDTMSVSVAEMRSKCLKLKMEKGLDLVVIDYIQLMQGGKSRAENRQLEVAQISRSLKALAKELDVPVLALSQLARQAEKEDPNLSHLRESGALEQDADVVLMLNRPKRPGEGAEEGGFDEAAAKRSREGELLDVIVAKHRNGPTGMVKLLFLNQFTAFRNPAEDWIRDHEPPPEKGSAF